LFRSRERDAAKQFGKTFPDFVGASSIALNEGQHALLSHGVMHAVFGHRVG
jgi:hypothetical protein